MTRRAIKREFVATSVTIGVEQDSWLRLHPEINLSKFLRESLEKLIKKTEKVKEKE